MPEYIIALMLSAALGGFAWLNRRVTEVDDKVDGLTVKVAQEYATKEALSSAMSRLEGYFMRIEDKLDKQVMDLPSRIANIMAKNND